PHLGGSPGGATRFTREPRPRKPSTGTTGQTGGGTGSVGDSRWQQGRAGRGRHAGCSARSSLSSARTFGIVGGSVGQKVWEDLDGAFGSPRWAEACVDARSR